MKNKPEKWRKLIEFENVLHEEECDKLLYIWSTQSTLIVMYAYYHYFNADITRIDDMLAGAIIRKKTNLRIAGIYSSVLNEDSIDFLSQMDEDYFRGVFLADISEQLNQLAKKMAYVLIKTPYMDNGEEIKIFTNIDKPMSEDNIYTNRILCDFDIPVEEKIRVQREVSSHEVKWKNIRFDILFRDDIQEEIDDIENPKEYVASGELVLMNKDSICFFGEEKSFITMISAFSLKRAFFDFGNKGLLDSNLRFFVPSKKIDPKIIDSISNDSENFCYYNNGIIVTCDDYVIEGRIIKLSNFSIVNGGQTTNLIGRTDFEEDFPVVCKLIKNKYDEVEKRVDFLAKVAEASNTQKPINAKDLIANRREQRLLKIQFERCGIFLKVKRGEKIDKSVYSENWQNASNDEIAQFIYSMVYQSPGSSKNSKSKLLDTEKIYKKIFSETYNDDFFVSVQHLKVAYNEWIKKLKRKEAKSSTKLALSKHGMLYCFATYSLIYKAEINDDVRKCLTEEKEITHTNERLKLYLQQNDIGQTKIFLNSSLGVKRENQFFALFEEIFGDILLPAYKAFKKDYPSYAYSHFVKSDAYYYAYIVPKIIDFIGDPIKINNVLTGTDLHKVYIDYEQLAKQKEKEYRPGLEQELIDLRKAVYHDSNFKIQAYEVLTNRQLANITKYLPKTRPELARTCNFKPEQLELYGDRILAIIEKYTSIENIV